MILWFYDTMSMIIPMDDMILTDGYWWQLMAPQVPLVAASPSPLSSSGLARTGQLVVRHEHGEMIDELYEMILSDIQWYFVYIIMHASICIYIFISMAYYKWLNAYKRKTMQHQSEVYFCKSQWLSVFHVLKFALCTSPTTPTAA